MRASCSLKPGVIAVESLERRALLAADLTGTLDVPVGIFAPGDTVSGSYTLMNVGDTAAGAYNVQVILSADDVFGNADDIVLTTADETDLAPGGEMFVTGEVELPELLPLAFFVILNIDSDNMVPESNETNNAIVSDLAGIQILSDTGVLPITGTSDDDAIVTSVAGDTLTVSVNGTDTDYDADVVTGVAILAGDGDDVVIIGDGTGPASVVGGIGKDRIAGSAADDLLVGGPGRDRIDGGAGNDTLMGGKGNDVLRGQDGRDKLRGGLGNDVLDGGAQRDVLVGGDGADSMYGQGGNDYLISSADGVEDLVRGGLGTDGAEVDELDDTFGIEDLAVV